MGALFLTRIRLWGSRRVRATAALWTALVWLATARATAGVKAQVAAGLGLRVKLRP